MKKRKNVAILFFILIFIPIWSERGKKNSCSYFAHFKYLSGSIYFLSQLSQCNYCYIPCNIIEKEHYIQIDSTLFFHKKIKSCLHTVARTGSFQPIITLLKEAIHYFNNKDRAFMHEIFLLIFTVHKQILLYECKENDHVLKKNTLDTIVDVSEKINDLPIAEVLNAIDMLMTELPPFLEKYELTSAITWKTWLKKYWWVPPVFGGWFMLRILLNFQRSYYYDYRYGHHKPGRHSTDRIITNPDELSKITIYKNEK